MSQTRQLAAIMFTDIVGYTALMGKDEQKAFDFLNKNRQIQKPIIEQHGGHWIKELGDGVLASFSTVSDAVTAAIKIQEACNAAKDFQLRIGIHLGEVVFENDDVFGDGVNIASRIQAIAEPNSIYISESVNQNVSNKPDINTQFVKQEMLKNVKGLVNIYQVITGLEPFQHSFADTSAQKSLDKSILVLPFVNISNDPEQEYFSDGLTEEIITDLSQIEELRVISRSSAMTFKGSNKKTKDIANEIAVYYVLEGSVRKSGNDLRIVAQLINAAQDVQLWAEKYSGKLDDVFTIQEQVSRSIVSALKIKLNNSESKKLAYKPIKNPRAYELYQKAQYEIYRYKEDGLKRAIEYLDDALKVEGENVLLYSKKGLAFCMLFSVAAKPEADYFKKARYYASKVFDLEPESFLAHAVLGWISLYDGHSKDLVSHMKKANKANPGDPDTLVLLILGTFYVGLSEDANQAVLQMGNVDPLNPVYYALLAICNYSTGDVSNAFKNIKRGYDTYPEIPQIQLYYAYFLMCNDRSEEAEVVLDRYISETSGTIFQSMGLLFRCALKKRDPADELTSEAVNKLKIAAEWAWLIADFYSLMARTEDAMLWLEYAVNKGFINYPLLSQYDPFLKNLQHEKQFEQLMKRVQVEWESAKTENYSR